jgi:hypothetical protein
MSSSKFFIFFIYYINKLYKTRNEMVWIKKPLENGPFKFIWKDWGR